MNFDEKIPAQVRRILKRLKDAGYEAYIVGGCVRDLLLGRDPADWDITTSARPEQVKACFKRTLDTGIQHGTVSVLEYEQGKPVTYEITTYRIDGIYEDGRHPKQVEFTASLSEDLRRRDFTINAMAYAPGEGLTDLFGGREDLEKRRIRAVGDPEERFSEDALRMMRAIRFSAQLDAEVEGQTGAAILKLAPTLEKVSAERIRVELEKLLLSDHPGRFRQFYESGLTKVFLPEWDPCMDTSQENPHHCYNVGEHILHSLESIDTEALRMECGEEGYLRSLRILRLTMLLHDIAKPRFKKIDEAGIAHFHGHPEAGAQMAEEILKRLKYDNDTVHSVKQLVLHHEERFPAEERALRRAMSRIGEEYFPVYFRMQEADCLAQSSYMREEKLERLRKLRILCDKIKKEKQPLSVKDLALGGADLREAGVKPGPGMGAILKEMLEDVIDEPEHNTREYLLKHYVYERKEA
ncbi:MAG: HD domain-containing protein [Lachnospiraceae bacterium]|nr:HD domain-containing protein [Lachnospiraceae bacterium]